MIGDRLGKWVIHRELGRGGMGRVYLVQEEITGEKAAIKILAGELAQDPGFLSRFQREIDALSRLSHPNIVRFIEAGKENLQYYYAMEYVEGTSLEQMLADRGRLTWSEMLEIGCQAAPALRHVHDHGIVHRDIKPSNLLMSVQGELKLTDFGIAKVFAATHLTATGGVVGTAEYLSPEQAGGKVVGKRSDIYCLGAVFYALLAGRPPFQGGSYVDLVHKHRFAIPERLQRLVPEAPYEIDELIMQMLEKEPDKRPRDCHVLVKQLESIRRRLSSKGSHTVASNSQDATYAENAPSEDVPMGIGPATLMSKLVRAELKRQAEGGPVQQFFNKPWVIITLFLVCAGLLGWTIWPLNERQLFERGADLMKLEHPIDWERAWRDYFDPLNLRYPNHPYKEQLAEYRLQLEVARNPQRGDGQRFFQLGEHFKKEGNAVAAERVWKNLVVAFKDVDREADWVRKAERALSDLEKTPHAKDRWTSARQSLLRAQQLAMAGKREEAERMLVAIEELYRLEPGGQEILAEIEKLRRPPR